MKFKIKEPVGIQDSILEKGNSPLCTGRKALSVSANQHFAEVRY